MHGARFIASVYRLNISIRTISVAQSLLFFVTFMIIVWTLCCRVFVCVDVLFVGHQGLSEEGIVYGNWMDIDSEIRGKIAWKCGLLIDELFFCFRVWVSLWRFSFFLYHISITYISLSYTVRGLLENVQTAFYLKYFAFLSRFN